MALASRRVLFVCLGDICRSPLGEAILSSKLAARGLDQHFEIDSAGTIADHEGQLPDPRMRAAAARRGYAVTSRSRRITRRDLEHFDLIIAMDHDNLRQLEELDPYGRHSGKIHLLGEYLTADESEPCDVPDPYYGTVGMDRVVRMVEQACDRLVEQLAEESTQLGSQEVRLAV